MMTAVAAFGALGAYFSQRAEIDRLKEDAEAERALTSKRDFEHTFFSLLPLLHATLQEIEARNSYGIEPKFGRDAVRRILDEHLGASKGDDASDKMAYDNAYRKHRDDLGHYFRLIYQIVRFIDESSVIDKQFYARLLRANLSNAEMVLLGLNCVYGGGNPKFKKLVEKYALLHNISSSEAISRRLDINLEKAAFGDRNFAADTRN